MGSFVPHQFGSEVDPAKVREAWVAKGFTCERLVDPPGRAWHWESHEATQIATVIAGQLTVEMHEGTVRLDPGDEAVIPAGCWHRAINSGPGALDWLYGYDR
jgi:quercetin dioxygenase-like cupin family protein